jgi:hypothetical protein
VRQLSGSCSTQFAQPAIVPPASDSSLASSTDFDSMHQDLPTEKQVEVGVVVEEQPVVDEQIEENVQHDYPTLKSGEQPYNTGETIAETRQLEEEQSIESVSSVEEMINAVLPPPVVETIPSEPVSEDSISTPPAIGIISLPPVVDTIPQGTVNSIMSLPLQQPDTQSIAESAKSAPEQLETTTIPPLLDTIPEAPVTVPSLKSAQLENIADLPVVPKEPAYPILSTVDESDKFSSISSEERFDKRQTLSPWAASTDSGFGVAKLPSLDSEFDKDVYQTFANPVKPERVEKMVRSGIIQERANIPPGVQLNVVRPRSAAPQIDDSSSSTSSDDDVDIYAHLANIRQRNGVKVASHAPPPRVFPVSNNRC